MLSRRTGLPGGRTPTFDPAALTARLLTRTRACAGAEVTASRAVIILLRLAMCIRAYGFRCQSTWPVDRSNSSPARGSAWKAGCTTSPAGSATPRSANAGLPSGSPLGESLAEGRVAWWSWPVCRDALAREPCPPVESSTTVALAASTPSAASPRPSHALATGTRSPAVGRDPRQVLNSAGRIAQRPDDPRCEHQHDQRRQQAADRESLFDHLGERQERQARDEHERE